jgi:hypothetical protein
MSKEFSGEDTAKFSSDIVADQVPTLSPDHPKRNEKVTTLPIFV